MENCRKHFNRCIALVLAVLLVLSVFLNPAFFADSSKNLAFAETISVSTENDFKDALENAKDGDIIDLGGSSIQLSAPEDGREPIINHSNITIQNGELSLRPAGIVQGADLSLKNLTLTFQNSIRNGIFANGFNTIFENVNRSDTSAYSIHVVMGPIINPQSSIIPDKSLNSNPKLTIKGENSLGQIFMGPLDDVSDDEGTDVYYDEYHPTVTVDTACKSVFASNENNPIYACGVSEKSATSIMDLEKTGDVMIPNADRLRVNSTTASINLGGSQVKSIYGNTGADKKISVNYYGGEYLTENVVLDCVSEINVKTGSFKVAKNTLSSGAILAGVTDKTALEVDEGATLIAGNLGDVTVNTFRGGGTLALGTGSTSSTLKQTLSIASTVLGTTNVVFGDMNNFWKTGVTDHVYVKAPSSFSTSFEVNNTSCIPTGKLWNRNVDGEWSFVTEKTEHEHEYGYVSIDDKDHAYECVDPKCPEEDRGQLAIEEHYDDDGDGICDACGYGSKDPEPEPEPDPEPDPDPDPEPDPEPEPDPDPEPDCQGAHTWNEGVLTKEPTCEEVGEITYTCSVCGATKEESVVALGHDFVEKIVESTCEKDGSKTDACSRCGQVKSKATIKATGHTWDTGLVTREATRTTLGEKTYTCLLCGKTKIEEMAKFDSLTMHRLYNRWTGEHFYTSDDREKEKLVKIGWNDESVGWYAPKSSNVPVFRLYNKHVEGGDHHYTIDESERDSLIKAGWTYEGIGWYSDESCGAPLYRQYNPYADVGTHNYTTSSSENEKLVKVGWREEGIAWYGMK